MSKPAVTDSKWFGALGAIVLAASSIPARADVLSEISATGTLTAGARRDSLPFGYVNAEGEWVGFAVDLLELVRQQAERELGRPVRLELVPVTPQDRFGKVERGEIAIECGSTTITWERERRVDFSLSYFVSGTQLLAPADSDFATLADLADRRIGVVPDTTNAQAIAALQPDAIAVPVSDRADGLAQLEAGEIDAFASDGIVLAGLRERAADPAAWAVMPEYPLQVESYACSLPEDDSRWRDLVNFALARYMQGLVTDRLDMVAIYSRWFGFDGVLPYPREAVNAYYTGILYGVEWIPVNSEIYE